jgi:hypothetical protein
MRAVTRLAAVVALATGGSVVAVEGTAWALATCERFVFPPTFSGSTISGSYQVSCTETVRSSTLYGRIKEDRTGFPDVVHDTESISFTRSGRDDVVTSTCQNGDDIYTEGQINGEVPAQSSRREMRC